MLLAAMDGYGWIALAILVVATTLFITKRLPIPVTALMIPVALYATGVLKDAREALSGFGNHAALAIASIFVLGAGFRESGVATVLARGLQRVGGQREGLLIVLIMLATAGLSAFMSNAAVVALLLPVVVSLARRAGVPESQLLMPLAFAAVLGGTISLIGTAPNFLVGDYLDRLARSGAQAVTLEVFDFAPGGIAITVAGIIYMVVVGRRMLPRTDTQSRVGKAHLPEEVADRFGLANRLFMARLVEASMLCGSTIGQAEIRPRYGLNVLLVRRASPLGERWMQPDPELELQAGDRLYLKGDEQTAWRFCEEQTVQFGLPGPRAMEKLLGRGGTVAELTIPPRSDAVGSSLTDLDFRKRTGLNVVAVWRPDYPVNETPREMKLRVGDTLLVSGSVKDVHAIGSSTDYILLSDHTQVEDLRRAPVAIALVLLALVPAIFFSVPLPVSAMGAALLMVASRIVSRQALAKAMDWNVLCLIVGTVPLGIALESHGVADLAADGIGAMSGGTSVLVIALLFLLSALFAVFTSNAAAAVIMSPVALKAGVDLGLDPKVALLSVAFGCSCAFVLPFAQCNVLVMAPGGYRTRDFIRVGLGMSAVMFFVTLLVLMLM